MMGKYVGIGPMNGITVHDEDAYWYAMMTNPGIPEPETDEDKQDFVEWYFSGNWVHYEDDEEENNERGFFGPAGTDAVE